MPGRLVGVAVHADERPALAGERRAASPRSTPARSARRRRGRSARSFADLLLRGRRGSRRVELALRVGHGEALEGVGHDDGAPPRRGVQRRAHEDRAPPRQAPASIRSPCTSSRTTASTQRCRSSRRLRPTIVSPCIGQSMPAARTRSCSPRSSREVTRAVLPLADGDRRRRGEIAERELEQLEVGAAQRRRLRTAALAARRRARPAGPGTPSGPTDPARSSRAG